MTTQPIIRAPTEPELLFCAEMGREFHAGSAYSHIPYDIPSMLLTLKRMSDQRLLLVAEVENRIIGAVGVIRSGIFFNANILVGIERFWWLDPAHRKSRLGLGLLAAIEVAAAEAGCVDLIMLSLEDDHERAATIYGLNGYSPVERAHIKRLRKDNGLPRHGD